MKTVVLMIISGIISVNASAQHDTELQSIRKLIGSFINDLNRGDFSSLPDYCTKEWIHINSYGGVNYGRDEGVQEIFQTYKTNLKDAKIAIDKMTVRMISQDAAIITVIHKIDSYTDTRAIKYSNQQQVKTFVVVKQADKWLLALDQSTVVAPQ